MASRRRNKTQVHNGFEADEQYISLSFKMLKSEAWRGLSASGAKVFLELCTRYHGGNNGKLSVPLVQGANLLGMSKTTIQRALLELQERGFLKLQKQGHWYGRKASEWECTLKSMNGLPPTNDWKYYKEPKEKIECGTRKNHNAENMSRHDTQPDIHDPSQYPSKTFLAH